MTVWDDTFEASPSDSDEVKYGASKIREHKGAVSERGELEHNFKAGTRPFHKAGKCTVVYVGTTNEIEALTNTNDGCVAYDTTLNVWKVYDGTVWQNRVIDHGLLSGLGDDDHPEYLRLDKEEEQKLMHNLTVDDEVTIDGRDLSADGAIIDALPDVAYENGIGIIHISHNKNTEYTASADCFVWNNWQSGSNNIELKINGVTRAQNVFFVFGIVKQGETWEITTDASIDVYRRDIT